MLFRPARLVVVVAVAVATLSGRVARADTTFYEAYQNGLAHEKEGAWAEAREYFLRAAELRPAPAKRVKSYGLNFIEPYDPAIHLARASLRLGLLDEARKNLRAAQAAAVSPGAEIAALASELEAARLRASAPTRMPAATAEPHVAPSPRPERTVSVPAVPPVASHGSTPASAGASGPAPVEVAPRAAGDPREPAEAPTPQALGPVTARATPPRTASEKGAEPSRRAGAIADVAAPTPSRAAESRPDALSLPRSGAAAGTENPPRGPVSFGVLALIASAIGLVVLVATRAALVIRARRKSSQLRSTETVSSSASTSSAGPEEGQSLATSHLSSGKGATPSGSRALSASTAAGARPLREGTDTRFGAYALEGILGRGGMGTTYVARRLRDGFQVALKVPHEHLLEEPEFVERFLREGALGALLRHPNIVRVYEAGEHAGRPFIAMELVPGTTLERVLRDERRLPLSRALHVARGVALALDYAHLKGIVHRDLKPENVMVLPDGEVKVMDYGIARRMDVAGLTATDAYLGTPSYSAPESLVPSEVGPQSDLYSLGVILFRMLSGVLPFNAPTPFELLHKHAYEPLPPFPPGLDVLPEVYGLLLELTAKSKQERYATAELFLRDLDQILNRL